MRGRGGSSTESSGPLDRSWPSRGRRSFFLLDDRRDVDLSRHRHRDEIGDELVLPREDDRVSFLRVTGRIGAEGGGSAAGGSSTRRSPAGGSSTRRSSAGRS